MKLLVLCERVDAEGGTESYLRATLPAFAELGDDVRVVARSAQRLDAYGVNAQTIAWSDEHDLPSAEAAARVVEIAEGFAPHAIAVHNVLDAGVLAAARATAARLVYHVHDHRPFCPNGDRLYPRGGGICGVAMGMRTCGFHALVHGCAYGPRPRTLGLIGAREDLAAGVLAADRIVALSRYVADLAVHNGAAAGCVCVLEPPLEAAAFSPSPAPRPPRDVVLFAGRVMPSKGLRSLTRALARVAPDRRPLLRIAGDGPDLAAALGAGAQLGVTTESLGRLDAAALRAAYDQATLVAVPSLWAEPFGLVGIEAFARGRPVVAYDAGGIKEWLRGDAGRLVPRGNERALAAAVEELLAPEAWMQASAAAVIAARSYGLASHVAALRAIYAGAA